MLHATKVTKMMGSESSARVSFRHDKNFGMTLALDSDPIALLSVPSLHRNNDQAGNGSPFQLIQL